MDSMTYTREDCRAVPLVWGPDPDNIARAIVQRFNIIFDFPVCISLEVDQDLDDLTVRSFTLSPDCRERCD